MTSPLWTPRRVYYHQSLNNSQPRAPHLSPAALYIVSILAFYITFIGLGAFTLGSYLMSTSKP